MELLSKALSRAYNLVTGVNPNALRKAYADSEGATHALAEAVEVSAPLHWEKAYADFVDDPDCQALGALFERYGSDKSTKHNYHLAYGALLKGKKNAPLRILEIGLGTNDPRKESSMGIKGKPGASLRAFRDWASKAEIFGADYDKNILFEEDRIRTFFVDQTKPETFSNIPSTQFDFIVDDGLPTPWANFNAMNALLPRLAPGGTYVVEDILDQYLPQWRVARALFSAEYDSTLVRMKAEHLCIIKKR
jgi:hypothetical protein